MYIGFRCFILSCIIFFTATAEAQNLYDKEHSLHFANHLFDSKEFCMAANEYQRLLHFDSTNNIAKLRLLQSHRLCGNNKQAYRLFRHYFGDTINTSKADFLVEYIKLNVLNDRIEENLQLLKNTTNINLSTKTTIHTSLVIISNDWSGLKDCILEKNNVNTEVFNIAHLALNERYKSPFLAACFSTIIPGSGKFYTKNYYDGIVSLMLVAGNAWQSYRGFNKKGIKSSYGWIMGGLTAGFYLGNIYGSAKSAILSNQIIKNRYREDAKNYLLNRL